MVPCAAAAAGGGIVLPRFPSICSPSSCLQNLKRLQLLIPSSSFYFPSSSSSSSLRKTLPSQHSSRLFYCPSVDFKQQHQDEEGLVEDDDESKQELVLLPRLESPKLSVKEKKELASFAHSLGKKLKSQQVGKSGVTPSVAAAFIENLESNELLKLKIHGSCPDELVDAIKKLEDATGSVAVDQIGRTVILYRPSPSKLRKGKAIIQRKPKEYSTFKFQKKGESPTLSGEKHHQFRRS